MQQFLKILNIAIFSFIIVLLLQLFLNPQKNNTITPNSLSITTTTKEVTIPNIPKISIANNTDHSVKYNPCQDFSLSVNSDTGLTTKISEFYGDKCGDVTIEAGQTSEINLSPLYKIYSSNNVAGQHILTIKNDDFDKENGKSIVYNVEKPGFFRSLISTVVYQPIYNLFVALLTVLPGHELGWAIVIITIIIRLILLIPQNKMLENSKKIAELNPKIKQLQEQYKDDRATLGAKLMELYKEEKVSPMGSCLPMLIQFPILIALYWVIKDISDTSNFYHLYSFFSNFDPNNIQTNFLGQDLLSNGGQIGIIMAVILGATQWLQLKLSFANQPKAPKKEKTKTPAIEGVPELPTIDQDAMQKMMLAIFPIMIAVTGYIFPLGLGLYWFIGLIFVIFQQMYVNKKSTKKPLIVKKNK